MKAASCFQTMLKSSIALIHHCYTLWSSSMLMAHCLHCYKHLNFEPWIQQRKADRRLPTPETGRQPELIFHSFTFPKRELGKSVVVKSTVNFILARCYESNFLIAKKGCDFHTSHRSSIFINGHPTLKELLMALMVELQANRSSKKYIKEEAPQWNFKKPSIPWIMVTLMQLSQPQNMVEVTVSSTIFCGWLGQVFCGILLNLLSRWQGHSPPDMTLPRGVCKVQTMNTAEPPPTVCRKLFVEWWLTTLAIW